MRPICSMIVGLVTVLTVSALCRAQYTEVDRTQQLTQEIQSLDTQIRGVERSMDRLRADKSNLAGDFKTADREAKKQKEEFNVASNMLDAVEKPMKAAKTKLDQAAKNLKDVTKKVQDDLEAAPEAMAAKKAYDDASDARAAARTAVLTPLAKNAEYAAATAAESAADANLMKLKYAKEPQQAAISRAAEDLLQKQRAVAVLEQSALKSDEAFQKADARVNQTNTDLQALRATFADKVKNNPERDAASKAFDAAKADHAKLQATFAEATKRQARAKDVAMRAQSAADRLSAKADGIQRQIDDYKRQLDNLSDLRDQKRRQLDAMR